MVTIPSNATGSDLAATLKFDVAAPDGAKQLSSAVTISAAYTVTYAAGLGGDTTTHPGAGKNIVVKKGAKLLFHNADTVSHITHGDGAFPHESTNVSVGGLPTKTYTVDTATLNGTTGNLGCHSHGNSTYAKFTIE
jgi:hypothetical protein